MKDLVAVSEILGILVVVFLWLAILARLSLEMLCPSNNSVELIVQRGIAVTVFLTITATMMGSWFYLFSST